MDTAIPFDPVKRLSRDLASAATTLSDDEARYLVDSYYMMQEDRKRAHNQVRASGAEPHTVLAWLGDQAQTLENQLKRALGRYAEAHPVGEWLMGLKGIGPVLAAGLLAHLSVKRWVCHGDGEEIPRCCPTSDPLELELGVPTCTERCGWVITETVGHWWRFAGLDPTVKWEKGQRRPWNAQLKTLCWKVGQSFMKLSNDEGCYYGQVYRQRKAYEVARNDRGDNAAQASARLPSVGQSTDAYRHLLAGKLPPAQLDARARRYAVKLFLAHLHEVWYEHEFHCKPPLPYAIGILGHAHKIPPPNLPTCASTELDA